MAALDGPITGLPDGGGTIAGGDKMAKDAAVGDATERNTYDELRAFFMPIDLDSTDTAGSVLQVPKGGLGVGTLGSGNFLTGAGTADVVSTKVVPTGDVVGTTDTQTLSSKTMAAQTLSGTITGADQEVNAVELGDYSEDVHTDATWNGTEALDYELGPLFVLTLSGNVTTLTFTNPPTTGSAGAFTIKLVQDISARTVAWPASVEWAGGVAPTLSTASGAVDFFSFITHDGGTTWYGFVGGQDFS